MAAGSGCVLLWNIYSTDAADVIEGSDYVTLGATGLGHLFGVGGFGVGTLTAGSVNIHYRFIPAAGGGHGAKSATEGDINRSI